mgnify:FL=1
MIISDEEKQVLDILSLISTHSKQTVKDVLFALLSYMTMNFYMTSENSENTDTIKFEMIIPFLCKLHVSYIEKEKEQGNIVSNISINAFPLQAFSKEILSIVNNEEPYTKKYFKQQNKMFFKKLLDLSDINENEKEELDEVDFVLS